MIEIRFNSGLGLVGMREWTIGNPLVVATIGFREEFGVELIRSEYTLIELLNPEGHEAQPNISCTNRANRLAHESCK